MKQTISILFPRTLSSLRFARSINKNSAQKAKILLALVIFISLLGCQSDDDQVNSQEQASLVGSWLFDNPGTIERSVLTFVDDKNFMLLDDGVADDDGLPGLERGTYTWTSETGAINTTVVTDTNGGWGLSGLGDVTLMVSENVMTFSSSGETFSFKKVLPSSGNALLGPWLYGTAGAKESSVLVFLDSSNYMLGDDGVADGDGQPGIERGSYQWNEASGALSATAATDTNGNWGLAPIGSGKATVDGNVLIFVSDIEGDTSNLKRIK